MNVIRTCTLRYLKANRKRTIITIAGVALASGLITATACMLMSFYVSLLANIKQMNGETHVSYQDVRGEDLRYFRQNQNLEDVAYATELGYVELTEALQENAYLYVQAADDNWYLHQPVELLSGRMPQREDEILIGSAVRRELGADYRIGDQITLRLGHFVADEQKKESLQVDEERTYTVVGLFKGGRVFMEPLSGSEGPQQVVYINHRSVFAYTYLNMEDAEPERLYDVDARYTKWGMRHCDQINAGLADVTGKIVVNTNLLKMELIDLRDKDVRSMAAVFLVLFLIVILAGVFSIINSFDISLTEKMRFYGMISSVGTTKRQRRHLVWEEAVFIGGIGIAGGLLLGLLISFSLVKFVNLALSSRMEFELAFGISLPALLTAVLFSALMVFLSAVEAADRAAKITPIEAIRSNAVVKNPGKPKKTPRYVRKLFGIGGCIAYQNFQRAKTKYRTIVLTIVVSISLFLGMSSLNDALDAGRENHERNKQIFPAFMVTTDDPNGFQKLKELSETPEFSRVQIRQTWAVRADLDSLSRPVEEILSKTARWEENPYVYLYLNILDEESFREYCTQAGVSYEEARKKVIVNADNATVEMQENPPYNYVKKTETIAEFQAGDVVTGMTLFKEPPVSLEMEVICQTSEVPWSLGTSYGGIGFFVSESWAEEHGIQGGGGTLYADGGDSAAMEKAVLNSDLLDYEYTEDSVSQEMDGIFLVATVFLTGFIGVIILIGVTNVLNVLTTNMELRAPEFAKLRAIGMTGKEFQGMIWTEGVFYGGRALLIGIPAGIFISYLVFLTILPFLGGQESRIPYSYRLPVLEILVSIAAVFFLLFAIMRYCMKKIGRRNVIETIRNENI